MQRTRWAQHNISSAQSERARTRESGTPAVFRIRITHLRGFAAALLSLWCGIISSFIRGQTLSRAAAIKINKRPARMYNYWRESRAVVMITTMALIIIINMVGYSRCSFNHPLGSKWIWMSFDIKQPPARICFVCAHLIINSAGEQRATRKYNS